MKIPINIVDIHQSAFDNRGGFIPFRKEKPKLIIGNKFVLEYIVGYISHSGGRNRRVAEAFVKTGRSIKELEDEMLNGQKLQGPITAEEVNHMLANKNMENK